MTAREAQTAPDHVREQMCRDVIELAERCRSGDASAEDLKRLKNAYRAVHGVRVEPRQGERQQLAVRVVEGWLAGLRNPALTPELFEDGIAAIPHWLAHLCDEPAFANAIIDGYVRKIVKRTYPGKPSHGARTLVALFAIRVGVWDADAYRVDRDGRVLLDARPDWYNRDALKAYADANLWEKKPAPKKRTAAKKGAKKPRE